MQWSFTRTLLDIQKFVTEQKNRSRFVRVVKALDDATKITQFNKDLDHALQLFQVRKHHMSISRMVAPFFTRSLKQLFSCYNNWYMYCRKENKMPLCMPASLYY